MKASKKKESGTQRRKKPADLPRRALSAYNLFFREQRGRIMEEQKRAGVSSANTFGALGRAVAEQWKTLPPEELEKYARMAAQDKVRYSREMEQYKANALLVHKSMTEERRFAGDLPVSIAPAAMEQRVLNASGQQIGASLHAFDHLKPSLTNHATSHPVALDASLSLAGLRDQLALSSSLGQEDSSLAFYSRLLAAQQFGNAQSSLRVPFNTGGRPVQHTSLLSQQLAVEALEAERGRQMEQQVAQHLLQNAVYNRQVQLALAQHQQQSAASSSSASPALQNYLAGMVGNAQQQQRMDAATQDLLLGIIPRDNFSSYVLTPQMSLLMQQSRLNQDDSAKSPGEDQSQS